MSTDDDFRIYGSYVDDDYSGFLGTLIRIFSTGCRIDSGCSDCALNQYFAAFIFMDLQYMGQTVFKSLNKKKSGDLSSPCFVKCLL